MVSDLKGSLKNVVLGRDWSLSCAARRFNLKPIRHFYLNKLMDGFNLILFSLSLFDSYIIHKAFLC